MSFRVDATPPNPGGRSALETTASSTRPSRPSSFAPAGSGSPPPGSSRPDPAPVVEPDAAAALSRQLAERIVQRDVDAVRAQARIAVDIARELLRD